MGRESLSAKLASGAQGLEGLTAWWPHHCSALVSYVGDIKAGTIPSPASTAAEELAKAWGQKVPCSVEHRSEGVRGLMTEHTMLELELVEAVFSVNPTKIHTLSQALLKNARAQGARYTAHQKEFPRFRFGELMVEHIDLMLAFLSAASEKGKVKATRCQRKLLDNSVRLGAFSVEWL